jgi:hypothetical protein
MTKQTDADAGLQINREFTREEIDANFRFREFRRQLHLLKYIFRLPKFLRNLPSQHKRLS